MINMVNDFLPISMKDLKKRGWKELDIILISGDAYVDHPSYGIAVISRFLESKGYKVGIIAQPDWCSTRDFLKLGRPRLFFGVTSGNVDSMVANYTANKKPRKKDDYSPGGKIGLRPDRAIIVYTNRLREVFGRVPIVIGGLEASLRRLAHYDYWDNRVRRSILVDSKADILVYGMGERQVLEIAEHFKRGGNLETLPLIRGTVLVKNDYPLEKDTIVLPSFEEVRINKDKFMEAFRIIYSNICPKTAKTLVQRNNGCSVIQFPPQFPLTPQEMDYIYDLPYTRRAHPIYNKYGGVKGLETVKFSIVSHRGCCGECAFCSLYIHQGRIVQSRSWESILKEAEIISQEKDFKGTITDIGGPTANLYRANCLLWEKGDFCKDKGCVVPKKCSKLNLGYEESLELYRKIRELPRIKHIFINSGFRYDLLIEDYAKDYLREICKFHISGQMKVAPEHIVDDVLKIMNKPPFKVYQRFVKIFKEVVKEISLPLYLVNYFISAHPGSNLTDTLKLALYLFKRRLHPEQVQDFIPLPMTLSACIYYTGKHPFTGENIYVPRTFRERKIQRALIQYYNPKSKRLILKALNIWQYKNLIKILSKKQG
ncbi:MAG: YgiQ family radical SAM protein [Candidatus Omnitrophica bacterium]|nr:YgiQ family radical SAM protein [Candidatus Omnitrophota bacterium]MCM8827133.1 YgiQ family radical SAM protein [Candidatus Omnitrophota bacterium]